MENVKLTEAERSAKEFLFKLSREGEKLPCDTDLIDFDAELPTWFDEVKYKRAQKYFANNRAGIFASNMVSLLSLLAHHKGLRILASTGRSSTPETARKRYVSTILHTLSWYEIDLSPGSKAWESVLRVRKMHLNASRSAEKKNLGFISQTELAVTQFGFMGFALLRPHIFNIVHDNVEDIEAFVHLWAVLGFMLGIQDQYNICLLPFDVVRIVCAILLRYSMVPVLQLEPPDFKQMTNALLDGLKKFMPHMSYDVQMFISKRAACVPGYQYRVDLDREVLCRNILTDEEIQQIQDIYSKAFGYEYMEFVQFTKVPIYQFTQNKMITEVNSNVITHRTDVPEDVVISSGEKKPMDVGFSKRLRTFLDLDSNTSITLTLVEYETEWNNCLNDSKFYELSRAHQRSLAFRYKFVEFVNNTIGRYIVDWLFSILMCRLRWFVRNS